MSIKRRQFLYPSIFIRDEDGSYQVIFPDLNIYTDGQNLSEAYINAKNLLKVYFTYATKYEVDYPKPTKLENILPKCKDKEIAMYVDAIVELSEL